MKVIKVVEEDIANKIDTAYILEQFQHIEKVVITFMCTKDGRELDDWVDEDGRYIMIRLPYKEVKKMKDVRSLMLAKAKERLGLVA
jgi:hypothetical protein